MGICLGCRDRLRTAGQYLCCACWFELPEPTRRRLNRKDAEARNRLFQLFSAIRRGVPLARIEVAA